jgi:hypothetical protein
MLNSNNFNANTIIFAVVLVLGLVLAVVVGDSLASGQYVYIRRSHALHASRRLAARCY